MIGVQTVALHGTKKGALNGAPLSNMSDYLVIQLQRSQNVLKDTLITAVLVVRADRDHVKQLAVAQLHGDDVYNFRPPRRFVCVAERDGKGVAPADISPLIVTARPEITVALLQVADELVRGLLQIAA